MEGILSVKNSKAYSGEIRPWKSTRSVVLKSADNEELSVQVRSDNENHLLVIVDDERCHGIGYTFKIRRANGIYTTRGMTVAREWTSYPEVRFRKNA